MSDAPGSRTVVVEFVDWLKRIATSDASDLHIKANSSPMIRERGELVRLDRPPLSAAETRALAEASIPGNRKARFEEDGELDFAHSVPGVGRFRANVFLQRGSIS